MKGDFTRFTHDPEKHYTRVLKQQGRVDLDADWNEQAAIQNYLERTRATDVIGCYGVPQDGGGFKVEVADDADNGQSLTLSPGRIYVEGLLCRNGAHDDDDEEQQDLPLAEQPGGFEIPQTPGVYLIYLDAWERHVTAVEDADLREVALGGPDTTTRAQTVWRAKSKQLGRLDDLEDIECPSCDWSPEERDEPQLAAAVNEADLDPGLCELPAQTGYRGLENRLYRVEVHEGGDAGAATFKWSRDNGTVVFPVESINNRTVTLQRLGEDRTLTLQEGDWVELQWDERELQGTPGRLAQITEPVDEANREITLNKALTPPAGAQHLKVRRWDHTGTPATLSGGAVPVKEGERLSLEDGVEVQFAEDSIYRTGDYWVIPARAMLDGTGGLLWPDENGTDELVFRPPEGIAHHYCPLALLEVTEEAFEVVDDCRNLFPPLTDICAEDVCYDFDPEVTPELLPPPTNVQEAIETLYGLRKDGCTLTAIPGMGWEALFERIGPGEDAQICFQAGTYVLDRRLVLENKGHLKLTGVGPGTRIIVNDDEAAFAFRQCASVTLRDLYVESKYAPSPPRQPADAEGLNGVLTFRNCESVTLESVTLQCAAHIERAAACASVYNAPDRRPRSVRIRHCNLLVGHAQVGLLLTNTLRARIEENLVRVVPKPKWLTPQRQLQSKHYRTAVRRLLIRNPRLNPDPERLVGFARSEVLIAARDTDANVLFDTDPDLTDAWDAYWETNEARGVQGHRQLHWHLQNVAEHILLHAGQPPGSPSIAAFERWYEQFANSTMATAAQGIVVGGRVGGDVQIRQNTIRGAAQGVHLGLSHAGASRDEFDVLGTMTVADNYIQAFSTPGFREQHGIFVGNCDHILLKNNYLRLRRSPVTKSVTVMGIRVYGELGHFLSVCQNHLVRFTTGVHVEPLDADDDIQQMWLISENAMPSTAQTITAPSRVVRRDNAPSPT